MFVARWNVDIKFGHRGDFLTVLNKWMDEVGNKVGWTQSNSRMLSGSVGAKESRFEHEFQVDSLEALEKAWAKFEDLPYHQQFGRDLEPHIVSGSNHWTIYRVL